VDDAFVAVVYSGYVWQSPDFEISITPKVNPTEPITPTEGSPALYTVTLEKVGPAAWPTPLNVTLSVEFLSKVITPTREITPTSMILTEGGNTAEITVHDTVTDTHYVSAFTLEAYDSVLGLERWASASFRYGGIDEPDFTLYSDQPEYQAEASEALTLGLYALGFGEGPNKKNVPIEGSISGDPLFCSPSTIDLKGGKIAIRDGQVQSGSYTLKVSDHLVDGPPFLPPEGVTCVIELMVDARPQYPTPRTVQVDLRIVPYSPGEADLKTFVIVEGFAPFRVSYMDTNTVAAFAIGAIRESPTEILAYQNPRLVPWAP